MNPGDKITHEGKTYEFLQAVPGGALVLLPKDALTNTYPGTRFVRFLPDPPKPKAVPGQRYTRTLVLVDVIGKFRALGLVSGKILVMERSYNGRVWEIARWEEDFSTEWKPVDNFN